VTAVTTEQPETTEAASPPAANRAAPGTKIAYFTGHFPQTTHTFFWREIQALESLGCQVDVISTRQPTIGQSDWRNQAARRTRYLTPFSRGGWVEAISGLFRTGLLRAISALIRSEGDLQTRFKRIGLLLVASRLGRWAARAGWQHIHVGFAENAADIAMLANRLTGINYSISLGHSIQDSGPNQKQKWSHASFGAAISRFLADEVVAHFGNQPPCPLYVAPRGIESRRFARAEPYAAPTDIEPIRLFSCARITPNKGPDLIIHAAAKASQSTGRAIEVRFAGGDSSPNQQYTRQLTELADSLGIGKRVAFLGPLTQPQVIAELHAADIAVIGASKTYKEGWGNAVAEAVAAGTPTVACRTGGVPETIDHGVNGLLAEPGNVDSLADCLAQLINDPHLAERLAHAGPRIIAQRFAPTGGASVLVQAMADAGRIRLAP